MSIIRDITIQAQKHLETDEILLFVGARQTGKTTILKQMEKYLSEKNQKTYSLNLEDPEYLELLNASPKNIFKIFTIDLNKKNFIFLDEIQYLKNPSNFLKYLYDEYKGQIKICASGSSAFYIDQKFRDSLAGRKRLFNVPTLSFKEFLRFKQENNLAEQNFKTLSLSDKEKIVFYYQEFMIFGGYPRVVLSPLEEKIEVLKDLAYSYVKKDVFESGIRQEEVFYKLFKILASQIGSLVNASELANTLNVSKSSIDHYLFVMQKSFHIKLIKPFFKNARKELTKMPKIYFCDLGLRNFFADNFKPFVMRDDKGSLLENAVFRQLSEKYNDNEIRFWRTTQKNEVDFILKDKEALEVKIDPKQFKTKHYKAFLEKYPEIKFSIVSFDSKQDSFNFHQILKVWEV